MFSNISRYIIETEFFDIVVLRRQETVRASGVLILLKNITFHPHHFFIRRPNITLTSIQIAKIIPNTIPQP